MTPRKKAKSQDVANLAGVSRTTVSLVLNGRDASIPERTRQKVLSAANELGFVPSAAARQLRRGQGKVVLCLAPGWMPSERADAMWAYLSNMLAEHGYTCVFSRSAGSSTPLRQLLEELLPRAVVSFFTLAEEDRTMLRSMGIPLVNQFPSPTEAAAGTDITAFMEFQLHLGMQQADYLLSKGAKAIGYLGTTEELGTDMLAYRVQGARSRLKQRGMQLVACIDAPLDDRAVEMALSRMLAQDVDAICAFNDDYAAAVIAASHRLDVSIPDRLRVIGIDNDFIGKYVSPSITTVDYSAHLGSMLDEVLCACDETTSNPAARTKCNLPDIWVVERESA